MTHSYVTAMYGPHVDAPAHPCWWCRWFERADTAAGIAWCNCPGCCQCRSQPENGCSYFEREPGADDDLWAPVGVELPHLTGASNGGPTEWAP